MFPPVKVVTTREMVFLRVRNIRSMGFARPLHTSGVYHFDTQMVKNSRADQVTSRCDFLAAVSLTADIVGQKLCTVIHVEAPWVFRSALLRDGDASTVECDDGFSVMFQPTSTPVLASSMPVIYSL